MLHVVGILVTLSCVFHCTRSDCVFESGSIHCIFPRDGTPSSESNECSVSKETTFFGEAIQSKKMTLLSQSSCDKPKWYRKGYNDTYWRELKMESQADQKTYTFQKTQMTMNMTGCYKANCTVTNITVNTIFSIMVNVQKPPHLLVKHSQSAAGDNFTIIPEEKIVNLTASDAGLVCVNATSVGYPRIYYHWEYATHFNGSWQYKEINTTDCTFTYVTPDTGKELPELLCFIPTCGNYLKRLVVHYRCTISNIAGKLTAHQIMDLSSLITDEKSDWFIKPNQYHFFEKILLYQSGGLYTGSVTVSVYAERWCSMTYFVCPLTEDEYSNETVWNIPCLYERNKLKHSCYQCPETNVNTSYEWLNATIILTGIEAKDTLNLQNYACHVKLNLSSHKFSDSYRFAVIVKRDPPAGAMPQIATVAYFGPVDSNNSNRNIDKLSFKEKCLLGATVALGILLLISIVIFACIIHILRKKCSGRTKVRKSCATIPEVNYEDNDNEKDYLIDEQKGSGYGSGSTSQSLDIPSTKRQPQITVANNETTFPNPLKERDELTEPGSVSYTLRLKAGDNCMLSLSEVTRGQLNVIVEQSNLLDSYSSELSETIKKGKILQKRIPRLYSQIQENMEIDGQLYVKLREKALLSTKEFQELFKMIRQEDTKDKKTVFFLEVIQTWGNNILWVNIMCLSEALESHSHPGNKALAALLLKELHNIEDGTVRVLENPDHSTSIYYDTESHLD